MARISKKSVWKISLFELQIVEKCMSRLCPSPLEAASPLLQTPKYGGKHMKRVYNMLYLGYLIIVNGRDIKKNSKISIFEV